MTSLTWAVVLIAGLTCAQGLGSPARIEDSPSTVQVLNRVATIWLQQGLANIITNFHAVGAASSFQDIRQNRRLCFGSDVRGECGTQREIFDIINHIDYNRATRFADISVVRFNASILFGPTISAVPIMPATFVMQPSLPVNIYCFGITAEGGQVGNNNLYGLNLESKTCQNAPSDIDTRDKFCAGRFAPQTGRDFDSRDIGGPVLYQGILGGVMSAGSIRQNDAVPIVVTNIASYTAWIVANAQ